MSTYSDILAGIRANAVKTPQGDGKTVLAKFLDGTIGKPTAPPEAPAPTDGTTDETDAGAPESAPESAPETPPEEADAPTDAPAPEHAPETMSAGALPEPDDAGDIFEPPPQPKRHGARRR